jgi:hypothetical protein
MKNVVIDHKKLWLSYPFVFFILGSGHFVLFALLAVDYLFPFNRSDAPSDLSRVLLVMLYLVFFLVHYCMFERWIACKLLIVGCLGWLLVFIYLGLLGF